MSVVKTAEPVFAEIGKLRVVLLFCMEMGQCTGQPT